MPTWKTWLITRRPRVKPRHRECPLSPSGENQPGKNGICQNCVSQLFKPMRALVVVEQSEDSTFDYWLRISTLDKGNPLHVPVKLAPSHQKALQGRTLNTSTTLHKRKGVWWLTLSFDLDVPLETESSAQKVGVDVGIANFITASTGKKYGSFHGKLARRHTRDREKRRRKARLRACLKKKGVEKLPSTSSASGQRLGRHVRARRSIGQSTR
jgi:hypothetical protein